MERLDLGRLTGRATEDTQMTPHRTTFRTTPRTSARLRLGLLGAAVAGLVGSTGTAAPAAAAGPEVYPVSGGVLTLDGHGYGHGRGMSQWGAQGAATQGVSSATILDTYYPGTKATVLPQPRMRIVLTGVGKEGRLPTSAGTGDGRYECDSASDSASVRCRLQVVPAHGLTVKDAGSGAKTTLPTTIGGHTVKRWRVVNTGSALKLQALRKDWEAYRIDGQAPTKGPLTFAGTHPSVRYLDGSVRTYRGKVSAVWTGSTRVARVNVVGLEDYLLSVVPQESPASWEPAALEAQAVAARSYSTASRNSRTGQDWHLCDSTYCQVYGGSTLTPSGGTPVAQESARTTAAVSATRSSVRTYGGTVVRAEFGAANGGWSVSGGVSWLPAREDPWDGVVPNSAHTWSTQVQVSTLAARYGLASLDELVVLSRDGHGSWGGRVQDVELRGTSASGAAITVRTTGDGIRATAGLRSSWWKPQAASRAAAEAVQPAAAEAVLPAAAEAVLPAAAEAVLPAAAEAVQPAAAEAVQPAAEPSSPGSATPLR